MMGARFPDPKTYRGAMWLVWSVWPVNVMLGTIVGACLLTALWLLGHHIRRVYRTRGDGQRMADLIRLNKDAEQIERGVRSFRERQRQMHEDLHSLATMTRERQREHRRPR